MAYHDQPRFGDFGSEPPHGGHEGPTRVSFLALSSLVTGIVSLLGCCVPALGLIPVVLGVAALVVVQRARGALSGRGLAIGGLIMGLLALVVSTGMWIGVGMGAGRLGPVYSQALSDDPAVVRPVLSSGAASSVTDERIAEFQAQMIADLGGTPVIPQGLGPLWRAYTRSDPADLEAAQGAGRPNIWPLPAETPGGGRAVVLIELSDAEQLGSGLPAVKDVGYVSPDGGVVWLVGGGQSSAPPPTDEGAEPPPDPDA